MPAVRTIKFYRSREKQSERGIKVPTPEEISKRTEEIRKNWPEHRWKEYGSIPWQTPTIALKDLGIEE